MMHMTDAATQWFTAQKIVSPIRSVGGRFCILEDACDVVAQFAEEHNGKIFEPINRRRSKKAIEEETKGGKVLKDWHDRIREQIKNYDENHWIKICAIC